MWLFLIADFHIINFNWIFITVESFISMGNNFHGFKKFWIKVESWLCVFHKICLQDYMKLIFGWTFEFEFHGWCISWKEIKLVQVSHKW